MNRKGNAAHIYCATIKPMDDAGQLSFPCVQDGCLATKDVTGGAPVRTWSRSQQLRHTPVPKRDCNRNIKKKCQQMIGSNHLHFQRKKNLAMLGIEPKSQEIGIE